MVLLRAAAAATLYYASTILAQGQSSSQAGNGVSGGILCGEGNLCPESSPCCSRKPLCLAACNLMLIHSCSRIWPVRCRSILSRWLRYQIFQLPRLLRARPRMQKPRLPIDLVGWDYGKHTISWRCIKSQLGLARDPFAHARQ